MVEGSTENARAIKGLLQNFELISGLALNFDKSCAYGVNVENECLAEMAAVLGCMVGGLPLNYLGLKVGGIIKGVDAWKETIEKMKKRLSRWRADSMSMGGRITIIKSVLSAIPVYNLSLMKLPKTVEKNLVSLFRNFLWGGKEGEYKMSWVSWDKLYRSVKDGGLGFKDLGAFNKALLGKWVWKFITEKIVSG